MKNNEMFDAYVFLRFNESTDFNEIYKELYNTNHVIRCDAVIENYDLAIKISTSNEEEAKKIINEKVKILAGIKNFDYIPIDRPVVDQKMNSMIASYENTKITSKAEDEDEEEDNKIQSYVFIEIEEDKFNSIYPQLYFMDEVVSCDVTTKKHDMIVMIQGNNFHHLDKIVRDKIWPIDGMIRARKINIIEMFQM